MDNLDKKYIVVYVGYEGIETIYGLFGRDKAIEKTKSLRKKDAEEANRYCVMEIDEHGCKCKCGELGLETTKRILY